METRSKKMLSDIMDGQEMQSEENPTDFEAVTKENKESSEITVKPREEERKIETFMQIIINKFEENKENMKCMEERICKKYDLTLIDLENRMDKKIETRLNTKCYELKENCKYNQVLVYEEINEVKNALESKIEQTKNATMANHNEIINMKETVDDIRRKEQEIKTTQRNLEKTIEEVKGRSQNKLEERSAGENMSCTNHIFNELEGLKFYGDNRINASIFMRNLEQGIGKIRDINRIKGLIRRTMKDDGRRDQNDQNYRNEEHQKYDDRQNQVRNQDYRRNWNDRSNTGEAYKKEGTEERYNREETVDNTRYARNYNINRGRGGFSTRGRGNYAIGGRNVRNNAYVHNVNAIVDESNKEHNQYFDDEIAVAEKGDYEEKNGGGQDF
ncbi:hypothetical protein RN001_009434 [Aquatica leii]|uniref:Uncharacterized protein n=1 Tax=Aquatica leii TaxID=1421715 RepID=A0AAN7SMX7_9COLE|nr:hypothetical protein RN001_009434 [Aquatica leii]